MKLLIRRKKYIWLFFFCCGCWTSAYGQKTVYDTIYQITHHGDVIDSVIIIKKRVIMTKKVFYTKPGIKKASSLDVMISPLFADIQQSSDKNNEAASYNSSTFQQGKDKGYSLSMMFHQHRKEFILSTGLRIQNHYRTINYFAQKLLVEDKHIVVEDTLDVYITVVGDDTTYTYVTEPRDIYFKDTTHHNYAGSYRNTTTMLSIPVYVGYYKRFSRWTMAATTGPVFSFVLRRKIHHLEPDGNLVKEKNSASFHSSVSINSSVQFSYLLDENSAISIQPYLEQIISGQHRSLLPSTVLGFQVGVKYFL